MPWGGVIARLRSSELLRRFIPLPVAVGALGITQRLAVARRPEKLALARATMEAIVGGTSHGGDLDRLAMQQLLAWSCGWEHAWRPWLVRRMPVDGLERLAAIEPGRGVVFSRIHTSPPCTSGRLASVAGPIHQVVGDHLFAPNPPGYGGYQNEQVRKLLTEGGVHLLPAHGSRATLAGVLRRGGRVLVHFDVPGSAPVRFLGKTVELKSGTARLAMDTDAVVVPVATLPRGRRWALQIGHPLDPRDHDGWSHLLQALATAHEQVLLRAPHLLETPLRQGGWAEATPAGWWARVPEESRGSSLR